MTQRRRFTDFLGAAADGSTLAGTERFVDTSGEQNFTADAIAARAVASGSAARRRHGHGEDNARELMHRSKLRFEDRMLPAVTNTASPNYMACRADLPGRYRMANAAGWIDFGPFELNDDEIVDVTMTGSGVLYAGEGKGAWRGTDDGLATSNADFGSVTFDAATSSFTFTAGNPATAGYARGDLVRFTNTASNAGIDFEIRAFGGAENRQVTVYPQPVTDAVADASFTFTRRGRTQLAVTAGQVLRVIKSQTDIVAALLPVHTTPASAAVPAPDDIRPVLGQSWAKRTAKNGYRGAQAYRSARGLGRFLRMVDCAVEASAMAAQDGVANAFWNVSTNSPGANYAAARDAILAAKAAYPGVTITDAACIIGSGDLPNLSIDGVTGGRWLTPAVLKAAYLAFFAQLRSDTGLPSLRIWITPLSSAGAPAGIINTIEVNWTIVRWVQTSVMAADANCRRGSELGDIPQPWQDGHNSSHSQSEHQARIEHWIAREKNGLSNGRGVKITGFARLAAKQYQFTLDRFGGNSSSGLNVNALSKPDVLPLGFGIGPAGDLWATPMEIEDFDWSGDNLILKTTTDDVAAIPVFPLGYNRHAPFRPAETVRVWDRNLALSDVAGWQPVQTLAHTESGGVFTPDFVT